MRRDNVQNVVYDWLWSPKNPVSSYHAYHEILKLIPDDSKILDVGAGTGIYFSNPAVVELIKSKNLSIKCIDIDQNALEGCRARIAESGLEDRVSAECMELPNETARYDYVFMIMLFPLVELDLFTKYINHARNITNSAIIAYHNLVEKKDKLLAFLKSNLKYLVGVDFGRTTTVAEMEEYINSLGFNKWSMSKLLTAKYSDLFKAVKYLPIFDYSFDQYLLTLKLN